MSIYRIHIFYSRSGHKPDLLYTAQAKSVRQARDEAFAKHKREGQFISVIAIKTSNTSGNF